MNIGKQISIGFKGYLKAIELLFSKGYMKFMLFPLLLNIVIFWIGLSQIVDFAVVARESFINWVDVSNADFFGSSILKEALSGVITAIVYLMFFLAYALLGGYLIMIILSPLFSIISEKTERLLTDGEIDYPFNLSFFLNDIIRGIGIALRNVIIELGILVLIFILGLIFSFISWIGVILMFFISAYFYGFSYMDYTNERNRLTVKESVSFMRKYKWVAIINGSLFAFVLFIPYIGVALSAFIAVISVIAGAVSMLEINKYENANISEAPPQYT